MEELQGWWEVPTIAHFCHVFQAAFDLFHFEIEELESALLQNDNPYCATVEQLAMRLVKGCYARRVTVTPENWEEMLHKLLDKKVPRVNEIQHLGDFSEPFNSLPVRKKIEILLKLCELRLDNEEVQEAIKNLRSRDLRVEPIGIDSNKNAYFYFFGLRLYKENLKQKVTSKAAVQIPNVQSKKQGARTRIRNSIRSSGKRNAQSEPPVISSTWSIVCHKFEDWEALIRKLKSSKFNYELADTLEKKYLPIISDLIMKREQLERKRLLEFMPRRTSSRIEKVRQQRESNEAAAEEIRLQKLEEERQKQAFENENKRKREIEERAKRAEERRLAVEERANRAKLREQTHYSDSSDHSCSSTPSRSRSPIFQYGYYEAESSNCSQDNNVNSYSFQSHYLVDSEKGTHYSEGNDNKNGFADIDVSSEENVDSDDEKSDSEDEDSEDENNSSDQTNSLKENKICDKNVNLEIRTIVYPRDTDRAQYQNVQPYASRNFQQVNGACVEPHTSMKTYSRLNQQVFINTNSVRPEIPVSKLITLNFCSNIPQNSTLTRPVRFHSSKG